MNFKLHLCCLQTYKTVIVIQRGTEEAQNNSITQNIMCDVNIAHRIMFWYKTYFFDIITDGGRSPDAAYG